MNPEITKQLEEVGEMTVPELRERYAAVFNEETRSTHKRFLQKRIAWGLQARAEGDLSERARQRAEELADETDLRLIAPKGWTEERPFRPSEKTRLPLPGTVLTREFQGETITVTVLDKGVAWKGKVYRSLSAVAKTVTGSHWGGPHFFGLRDKEKAR